MNWYEEVYNDLEFAAYSTEINEFIEKERMRRYLFAKKNGSGL